MRNLTFPKIVLGFAALCLLVVLLYLVTGNIGQAGPFFIAFFVLLAIGFRGYASLKGFAYTVTIFAAVTTAMFYPQYFRTWNGFVLSTLITPLLQIIMFGMGTSMGLKDFAGVIKTPKGVFIGVVSHFIIMPLIGYTLASISGLPPEIAAGIILIGCSPNGMASNVISYLAKANLALSITITAVSTMLSPFVTPFLMKWLAGAFVNINALNMMWDIIKMVILPISAGILFNRLLKGKAKWLDDAMPIVSMTGIAFIIVIITAAGRDNLLQIGLLLIVFVLIHNLAGYTLGYWTGRLFKMDERDCRTMAIEVGMQNGGLASGLAKAMGKMATVGLAPAIFGPLMNITGSILASWWHRRPPKEKPATTAATTVLLLLVIGCGVAISSCNHPGQTSLVTGNDYPVYGGNKAGNRYSPLEQINTQNVSKLRLAWTYDVREKVDTTKPGYRWGHEIQCQPIAVNGILYGTTPALAAFAVGAATASM